MTPHHPQGPAPRPQRRLPRRAQGLLPRGFLARSVLSIMVFCLGANALYVADGVTAYRVANKSIVVDGKPELLWKGISALPGAISTSPFNDYRKIVLLQADNIRNANPAL